MAVGGCSQKLSELGKDMYLAALVICPEVVVLLGLPVHDESTYEVIEASIRQPLDIQIHLRRREREAGITVHMHCVFPKRTGLQGEAMRESLPLPLRRAP